MKFCIHVCNFHSLKTVSIENRSHNTVWKECDSSSFVRSLRLKPYPLPPVTPVITVGSSQKLEINCFPRLDQSLLEVSFQKLYNKYPIHQQFCSLPSKPILSASPNLHLMRCFFYFEKNNNNNNNNWYTGNNGYRDLTKFWLLSPTCCHLYLISLTLICFLLESICFSKHLA